MSWSTSDSGIVPVLFGLDIEVDDDDDDDDDVVVVD